MAMDDSLAATLQRHARSLRELARALVGADDADDVVQATAAAALAHPHPVRQPLAFVRHVLRVQAHRHHRQQARRRRREEAHAAARAVVEPPAELALEQREAVAELHAALMAVPQPHLGALLLRYFEDLSPPAIAARLGVPLPTVKSRLQRGLELLRERLAGGANPELWRERLVRAFALPLPAGAASLAPPLLLMFLMKIAALMLLSCAVAWFVWWPHGDAPPMTTAVARADTTARAPSVAAANEANDAGATSRAATQRVAAVAVARVIGRVSGGVSGSADEPLRGAQIEVVPDVADAKPIATAIADAEGRFVCEVAAAGEHSVRVTAAGHVGLRSQAHTLALGGTLDLGTIPLLRGVVVHGHVVDRDDHPVANTPIAVNGTWPAPRNGFWWARNVATTATDGAFALAPVPPIEQKFFLQQEELLAPEMISLAGAQGEVDVLVRVESASRHLYLRGRVVDEAGRAIAGARLTAKEKSSPVAGEDLFTATSQDDGTFAVRRLRTTPPAAVALVAIANGCDETSLPALAWGRDDIEVVLRPLAALTVHVVDDASAPVPDYTLRIGSLKDANGVYWHSGGFTVHEVRGAAAGTFVAEGLRRGMCDVHVTPIDDALAASNVQRLAVAPGEHTTIVLAKRRERTLRLQFADGAPVAGARIELCRPCLGEVALGGYVTELTRWTNYNVPEKALLLMDATTSEDGATLLRGPAATPLALRVLGPGCLPAVVPLARLDGDGPLVVTARRGATLRVVAAPAAALDELAALRVPGRTQPPPSVWLERPLGRGTERVPPRDAALVQFDRDGIATLRGMPDGYWTPQLEFAAERIALPGVTLRDGETTEAAIDLAPLRPATLRGRVLLAGKPAALGSVDVERWHEANERLHGFWTTIGDNNLHALDADGRFVLRSLPGRLRVLLGADRGDNHNPPLAEPNEFTLLPGQEVEQTFTITLGTVAVRFVDAQQRPLAGVHAFLRRGDGYFAGHLPASDADGRARGADFEVRGLRLTVLPRRFGDPRSAIPKLYTDHPDDPAIVEHTQLDLGPVTASTGDPIEQTIVLPDAWFQ